MSAARPEAASAVEFVRDGRRFAVPVAAVRGVCAAPDVTRVPGAPRGIVGLLGWRGAVLPLVDPCGGRSLPAAAVVVRAGAGEVALAADDVAGWGDGAGAEPLDPDVVYQRARESVAAASGG